MIEQDVVLLAIRDEVVDSTGAVIILREGLRVYLYMEDADENGNPRDLLASGFAEKNHATDWSRRASWRCRIDEWGEQGR